ncbi:hypothetical protein chiPu_0004349 [Chiloscyllium punctatum]|uniref:Uncharacterized protein n=1 Tax=Chiloscyllium punctatum TaxID=137246 RepID=A0A401S6B9_CHIPU|nr:hypothetical protein [Chiloscyllium punctatum]
MLLESAHWRGKCAAEIGALGGESAVAVSALGGECSWRQCSGGRVQSESAHCGGEECSRSRCTGGERVQSEPVHWGEFAVGDGALGGDCCRRRCTWGRVQLESVHWMGVGECSWSQCNGGKSAAGVSAMVGRVQLESVHWWEECSWSQCNGGGNSAAGVGALGGERVQRESVHWRESAIGVGALGERVQLDGASDGACGDTVEVDAFWGRMERNCCSWGRMVWCIWWEEKFGAEGEEWV